MTHNEFSVCKAEESSDAVDTPADDNTTDGNSGKSDDQLFIGLTRRCDFIV